MGASGAKIRAEIGSLLYDFKKTAVPTQPIIIDSVGSVASIFGNFAGIATPQALP
tara:strand:+ start:562 stop:726 length:165 start_codon:yes stop_codon:yes gene_type:complete